MGWLSSLFGGGKKDGGSQSNSVMPSIYVMPQYDFTEPRLRETSSFLSDNIARMRRGEYPDYYQNALPSMREALRRPNHEAYYGRNGEAGILRDTASIGSITGIGPRSTNSAVEKALYDYGSKEQQIEEYLQKIGVDIMQRDATAFPQLSAGLPKGPDAQVVYPQVVGGQQVDAAGAGASLAGLLPNFGGITDLFGQSPVAGNGTGGGSSNMFDFSKIADMFGGSSMNNMGYKTPQVSSAAPGPSLNYANSGGAPGTNSGYGFGTYDLNRR